MHQSLHMYVFNVVYKVEKCFLALKRIFSSKLQTI